eukprot:IDg8410t1
MDSTNKRTDWIRKLLIVTDPTRLLIRRQSILAAKRPYILRSRSVAPTIEISTGVVQSTERSATLAAGYSAQSYQRSPSGESDQC